MFGFKRHTINCRFLKWILYCNFFLFFADETLVNGAGDIKVNGTNDSHPSVNSHQKYSQILGDHQTNNFTTQLSNKSTSSTTSSQNHIYKGRSFNNKENYYNNQRGGFRGGLKNGWHRSNSSISSNNYRATAFSSKDNKRTDENGKSGTNNLVGDEGREPIKFNEGKLNSLSDNLKFDQNSFLEIAFTFLILE